MPQPIATSTIVAQAITALEIGEVSSLADDTPEAQMAAEFYPEAMRLCLEAGRSEWSFAEHLVQLPELAALPADHLADPDLPHVFALPADLVVLREVIDTCRWRRDSLGLRTDRAGPLRVRYTRVIGNEDRLPASFRTAVALQLAVLMAPRWLTTQSKRAQLQQDLGLALQNALRSDSRQASQRSYRAGDDWGWSREATW